MILMAEVMRDQDRVINAKQAVVREKIVQKRKQARQEEQVWTRVMDPDR